MFVTDDKYRTIDGFETIDFMFTEQDGDVAGVLSMLNSNVDVRPTVKFDVDDEVRPSQKSVSNDGPPPPSEDVNTSNEVKYDIQDVDAVVNAIEKKGLFGGLL